MEQMNVFLFLLWWAGFSGRRKICPEPKTSCTFPCSLRGDAESSLSPVCECPPCAFSGSFKNTTVAARTISLGVLRVGGSARWLGWSPGLPGRGGREVAVTIKPCHHDPSFLQQTSPCLLAWGGVGGIPAPWAGSPLKQQQHEPGGGVPSSRPRCPWGQVSHGRASPRHVVPA